MYFSLYSDVVIEQTIPENDTPVCPGQVLKYTCFSNESSIGWLIGTVSHVYDDMDAVNSSMMIKSFETVLTVNGESFFFSTATNPKVTLVDNNKIIECLGGSETDSRTIAVAGT